MAGEFFCGAECGIVDAGATPNSGNGRHWDFGQGITTSTAIKRTGQRAYRIPPNTGGAAYMRRGSTTGTLFAGRVYFYIAAWPNVTMNFVYANVAAGAAAAIQIDTSTHEIEVQIGGDVNAVARPGALSLDTWYYVDFEFFCGASGYAKMRFNGEATEYESNTGQSATTFSTGLRFGTAGNDTTFDLYFDDIYMTESAGVYPIGAGKVVGLSPNSSGPHSFTAGDFGDTANTNIAVSDTSVVHGLIDDAAAGGNAAGIANISDWVRQKVVRTTGYVQFGFEDTPESGDALGMTVVSTHHASATGANTCTLKWWDGSTETAIYTNADFSQTSRTDDSRTYLTHPTSGTLTPTVVNGLRMRWGYSSDVNGVPYLDGVVLEVAYSEAAAGNEDKSASDTGAGADASATTAAQARTESASGAETGAPTGAHGRTDSATGADASAVTVPKAAADSAAGADTGTPGAAHARTDAGAGSDVSITTGTTTATDAGAGAETSALVKQGTDAATATEATTTTAAFSLTETAAGLDAGGTTKAVADTAAGTDVSSQAASATSTETGTGADVGAVSVPKAASDAATGTEAASPSAALSPADPATASEASSAGATYTPSDTAAGTDPSSPGASYPTAEAGSVLDRVNSRDLGSTEAGVGTDAALVQTDSAKIGVDSATGVDSLSGRAIVVGEAGTGTEAVISGYAPTTTDAGAGADTGAQSAVHGRSEAAAAAEAASQGAALTPADAGTTVDAASRAVAHSTSDAASGAESTAAGAVQGSTDAGLWAEFSVSTAGMALTDAGFAVDVSVVATETLRNGVDVGGLANEAAVLAMVGAVSDDGVGADASAVTREGGSGRVIMTVPATGHMGSGVLRMRKDWG